MGLFKSWKERRAYHKENAKTVVLSKGEKLSARDKAIRSQGYMAGQRAAWDESMHRRDNAGFNEIKAKRKQKQENYKAEKNRSQGRSTYNEF